MRLLIIIFTCLSTIFYSQKREYSYLTKSEYLLKQPLPNAEKLGVFAASAEIFLLGKQINGFVYVEATNGDKGYVKASSVTSRNMNYKDPNELTKYFDRGEQGFQVPHKFVQVSGLRARKKPNVNSEIVSIVPINEQVTVNYVPFSENAWVYIGDYFFEKPRFIQYKNLGKVLQYNDVYQSYEKSKGSSNEKELAERLLELSWQIGNERQTLQSLKIYQNYCQKSNTCKNAEQLDFEIYLMENMQNPYPYEDSINRRIEMEYVIDNQRMETITQKFLDSKKDLFQKTQDYSGLSECGIEPIMLYKFSAGNIFLEQYDPKIEPIATVNDMLISDRFGLIIDGMLINSTTSEKDFIKKFGRKINILWDYYPHQYRFPDGDAGFYTIEFRNGVPYRFSTSYYC